MRQSVLISGNQRQSEAIDTYLAPLLCRKVGWQVEQAALHDQDGRLPRAGRDSKEGFFHLELQLEHALLVPDERGNHRQSVMNVLEHALLVPDKRGNQ